MRPKNTQVRYCRCQCGGIIESRNNKSGFLKQCMKPGRYYQQLRQEARTTVRATNKPETCKKCHGSAIDEILEPDWRGWRCINCGSVVFG